MKIALALAMFIHASMLVNAQHTVGNNPAAGMDMNSTFGGIVKTIDIPPFDIFGSYYLFEEFQLANVISDKGDTVTNVLCNVNFLNKTLDYKEKNTTMAVPLFGVRSFSLVNIPTVPYIANFYEQGLRLHESVKEIGVISKLKDWPNYAIYYNQFMITIKANYYRALDSGKRYDEHKIESSYLISIDNTLYNAKVSKGKFLKYFAPEKRAALAKMMSAEKLNHKKKEDLIKIADFLNKL